MANEWFGRFAEPDERDANYPATPLLAGEARGWQYWWDYGWWGNQGATPRCVEYAWWHCIMDGPLTSLRAHGLDVRESPWLYCEAQKRDAWEGDCDDPRYDGTSIRGGAKALRDHGMISEYRWCQSVDEIVRAILAHGPVVMGTRWPDGFMSVGEDGYVGFTDSGDVGHAYVLNGCNVEREVVRIKNSWGRENWGLDGRAWMTLRALEGLMNEPYAEACVVIGV